MPKHLLPGAEGAQWRKPIRDSLLVIAGLAIVIGIMLGSYSSGFGNPKPHNIPVAVTGPAATRAKLDASPALHVHAAGTAAVAREMVEHRTVYGALIFTAPHAMTLLTAGGGGHSVAAALTGIAQGVALQAKVSLKVQDVAPTSTSNPNGTIEFYCIVFLSVGAALGSTLLGRMLGAVQSVSHLARRTLALVLSSAVLAGTAILVADPMFGALTGHAGQLFLAFWGFAAAISLACSGVSALLGSFAGIVLTLLLTILGNTSAGGAVGRPLLNPFYAALTPYFPHGAGIDIVRGVQYFHGRFLGQSVVCLAVWAAVGVALHATFAIRRGRQTATYGRHDASLANADEAA